MRIVIAEDSVLLREGIVRLLTEFGHEVTSAVSDANGLLAAVNTDRPDLAVVDVRMPPTFTDEGIRAALDLRRRHAGFPVVLLSQYVEQLYLNELLADGGVGVGYLLKDRVFDDVSFVQSLRTVARAGTAIDPTVVSALMERRTVATRMERLTPREVEVLALMAEGHANLAIAKRLFVTDKAVQKHINSLFAKLDLDDPATTARRVQAVLTYLRV